MLDGVILIRPLNNRGLLLTRNHHLRQMSTEVLQGVLRAALNLHYLGIIAESECNRLGSYVASNPAKIV